MSVTPAQFKTFRPQFADIDDDVIQFYLDIAITEMSKRNWGSLSDYGVMLLASHNLSTDTTATALGVGGSLEIAAGAIASVSKSAGGVSLSVSRGGAASNASVDPAAGELNDSEDGKKWYRLSRKVGARVLQIS